MARMTKNGSEMPDKRSLVAVCDIKPVTMGERIRKYQRTPGLKDDHLFHNEDYDPDDFHDDEDRPMSPHEERAAAFMERKKARKAELDQKRKEAAEEAQRAEQAAFRERVLAVKADIPKTE